MQQREWRTKKEKHNKRKIKQKQGIPEKWRKWNETEQNSNQKKQSKKEGQTEEEDSGREMNTNRVHVFHHAICEALINVSVSLERQLHAGILRLLSSSSSSLLLSSSLPYGFSSSPCADTVPPPAVQCQSGCRQCREMVCECANEVKCEILSVRMCSHHIQCNANPIHF